MTSRPMKIAVVWVGVLGCSSPTPTPAGSANATAPGTAPARDDVDAGTFVTTSGTKVLSSETFSIRRAGDHFVLRAKSLGAEDPENNFTEGELETDAQYRPLRAAFRRVTPADGFEYRLGGTPLTLDVTRDDKRDPQHVIAPGPVDVFIAGPGLVAMTPLCKVTGDVVQTTIGEEDAAWTRHVEAYRAGAVGGLQRIVLDSADLDFELLCEGERLIAGGVAKVDVWFVRAGREADLAALVAAARPPKKAWTHPVDETEPWDPLHTFLFDDVIVTRDRRKRTNRLTTFALADGAKLVHRDIPVPMGAHVMCEPLKGGRLICANAQLGLLQILDARTLADQVDLAPLLRQAAPAAGEAYSWSIVTVEGSRVLLGLDSDRAVELELDKRTAKVVPMPEHGWRGARDAAACPSTLSAPLKVAGATWSIEQSADRATLVRTSGGKPLPPLALPFDHPSLLACTPKAGGAYVVTYSEAKSVLAALKPDASVRWSVDLGAHPSDVRVLGNSLVVTTSDEARRVIALDAEKGTIRWVASGPLPSK